MYLDGKVEISSKKVLLELNGLQHYQAIDWFGGETTLNKQIQFDNMKKEYAESIGYHLVSLKTDHIQKKKLLKLLEESILNVCIET